MAVVVDSSVAASWCLPDEETPSSEAILDAIAADGMIVPSLFWYELRNVLIVCERRGRLEPGVTQAGLKRIGALPLQVEGRHDEKRLLDLARSFRLSVYDAAYLELAQRIGAPLATFDKALQKAAVATGITCLGTS